MKKCTQCQKEFPLTEEYWPKEKRVKSGLSAWCKGCKYRKQNEWKKSNKKTVILYGKEYRKKYSDEHKEYMKEWKAKNAEHIERYNKMTKEAKLEYDKKWHEENPDYRNEWAKNNPEKVRATKQRRRARAINALDDLTKEEWEETLSYFSNSCAYCGETDEKLEMEHVIPVYNGGGFTKSNIIPSCKPCNASKGIKPFYGWYKEYKDYDKKREEKILRFINDKNAKK